MELRGKAVVLMGKYTMIRQALSIGHQQHLDAGMDYNGPAPEKASCYTSNVTLEESNMAALHGSIADSLGIATGSGISAISHGCSRAILHGTAVDMPQLSRPPLAIEHGTAAVLPQHLQPPALSFGAAASDGRAANQATAGGPSCLGTAGGTSPATRSSSCSELAGDPIIPSSLLLLLPYADRILIIVTIIIQQ